MGTEVTVSTVVHSGVETQVRQGAGPPEEKMLNSFLVADNARFEDILNFPEQKVLVGKQSTGGEAGCDSRVHVWLDRVAVRKVPSLL